MDLNTWAIFAITIAVVIAIPGPLTLLMINSTVNYGMRKSMPIILAFFPKKFFHIKSDPPENTPISTKVIFLFLYLLNNLS